jgi:SAM-dependent methyltransferase
MQILSRIRRHLELQRQWEEDIESIRMARFEPRFAAPYVPTPMNVVREMLSFVEVGRDDVLYDLGCGDGRMLLTAALEYGARCVGIEIREDLVKAAITSINEAGMGTRARVIQGDMFAQDLGEATVVTLYLLSAVNFQLRPKLEKELKKGTRVVCHDFGMEGWVPSASMEVKGRIIKHTLYLYRI